MKVVIWSKDYVVFEELDGRQWKIENGSNIDDIIKASLVYAATKQDANREHVHEDSGLRCLAAHYKGDWKNPVLLPPCIKCSRCGEWIRPDDFENSECAAQPEINNDTGRKDKEHATGL